MDIAALLLRLSFGSMMMFGHGWGKLASFSTRAVTFSDPLGIGSLASLSLTVFAEFFCSLAVILGLATRATAVPLIIAMLVAATIIHGGDPFARMEKALLYLTSFLVLFFAGPGRFSLDALISRRLQKE